MPSAKEAKERERQRLGEEPANRGGVGEGRKKSGEQQSEQRERERERGRQDNHHHNTPYWHCLRGRDHEFSKLWFENELTSLGQ